MEKNYYILIGFLVFGIIGAFSHPGGSSEVKAVEDNLDSYRNIDNDTTIWLNILKNIWRMEGDSQNVKDYIYDYLGRNQNPYVSVLRILFNTHVFYNSNFNATLASTVLDNFRQWLSINHDAASKYLEPETKLAAFRFVSKQKCRPMQEKVAQAYEFEADPTFIPLIESHIREKQYRKGAWIAILTGLQGSFAQPEMLLLPLLVQEEIKIISHFLGGNQAIQRSFLIYMDRLIDTANVSQIFHQFIQDNRTLNEDDSPIKFRTVKDYLYQLVLKYRLSEHECPNIFQYYREKMLRFFLQKYPEERGLRGEVWQSTVRNLVGSYRKLKLLLVEELNRSGNFKEGLYWAQYYSIPMSEWFSDIRKSEIIELFSGNSSRTTLPKLTLPSFSGEYSSWPLFRDLFTSMVINNARITKMGKMEYLRASVSGDAARIIEDPPVPADSFDSAWALLTSRFENRRLLIHSQLDKLINIRVAVLHSAESLNAIVMEMTDALDALDALGSPVSYWDQPLVHIIVQQLDISTREAWKFELGSSTEFPSLDRFKSYLTERVRALERLEASLALSSPTRQSQLPYPCYICMGNHHIGQCPALSALTVPSRYNLINYAGLCENCLGHIKAVYCKTTATCRQCGRRHHTLLHPVRLSMKSSESTRLPYPRYSRPNVLFATALQ